MAIIGGGYTGLAAARALARRGADVVVLERHTIGWGASGRNGGFVLPGFKPDVEVLARKLGIIEARRLFELSVQAVHELEALIADEAIGCDYARCGTVVLAARAGHVAALERSRRFLRDELGHETTLLGASELRAEIGSARYHGGLLDPLAGSVQPARLAQGLALAAARAGARLVEGVDVRRVERRQGEHCLTTASGSIRAREVLVATNGYSGAAVPALRRRVVPVGSYLIATGPLDPALADRLVPKRRVLSDTKNLLYYFRLSTDGRMVFGGRAAFTPTPVSRSAAILARGMAEVFPELAGVPVEYAWGGRVAFTLDQMPHAGRLDDGVHYALGYGGHGVAMATWLGARMGDALAGAGGIPKLTSPFRAVPFYAGTPWFLPLVGGYYRARDAMGS
ncbi:MAG TPA: FAD-binding oxidoreductase [Gemmatimonadales bacterium]|nr:FAD-binding oxidoreductase [Gemmatimonadales bacterium]